MVDLEKLIALTFMIYRAYLDSYELHMGDENIWRYVFYVFRFSLVFFMIEIVCRECTCFLVSMKHAPLGSKWRFLCPLKSGHIRPPPKSRWLSMIEPNMIGIFWTRSPISFTHIHIFFGLWFWSTPIQHIPLKYRCLEYCYVGLTYVFLIP